MDNRPLKFDEFEAMQNQVIYVSATSCGLRITKNRGVVVEQVIRPRVIRSRILKSTKFKSNS
jgi:excinuclease ABC subunit B